MFHKYFDLIFGYFLFIQVLDWLFVNGSSHPCCDGDEKVNLLARYFECMYEWVVFSGFFIVCSIWEFVVAIGEFNELHGF